MKELILIKVRSDTYNIDFITKVKLINDKIEIFGEDK